MDPITGGSSFTPASKGKRILAGFFDLVIIPLVLGALLGFLLIHTMEAVRNIVLIVFNIGWLIFRDMVFSPGRAIVRIKLVSMTGATVTVQQALLRNIFLEIPVLLLIGYFVECISVLARNRRVADGWAKTQVVAA